MQRGHRWSITYFSGIPVRDALNDEEGKDGQLKARVRQNVYTTQSENSY